MYSLHDTNLYIHEVYECFKKSMLAMKACVENSTSCYQSALIIKDMISTEKQIVVTSNVITNDMYGIDYKLKNLLDSGMSVFICPNIENELVK